MMTKTSALSFVVAIGACSSFSPSSINHSLRTSYSRLAALEAEKKKIFIDGEAGTTGLQVRDRLSKRDDLEIISISDELRKDKSERKRLINEADCVILCKYYVDVSILVH